MCGGRARCARRDAGNGRRRPEVTPKRVVADAEDPARPPFVSFATPKHKPGIPTGPSAQRVVPCQRGQDDLVELAANSGGQVAELNAVGRRERDPAFEHPLQLADVAGPGVRLERFLGCRRQVDDARRPMALKKIAGQGQDVGAPLAQGRDLDVHPVQAVEEISPEEPLRRLSMTLRHRRTAFSVLPP